MATLPPDLSIRRERLSGNKRRWIRLVLTAGAHIQNNEVVSSMLAADSHIRRPGPLDLATPALHLPCGKHGRAAQACPLARRSGRADGQSRVSNGS